MQGRAGSLCASSDFCMQTSLGTSGLEQEHKSELKLLTVCQGCSNLEATKSGVQEIASILGRS